MGDSPHSKPELVSAIKEYLAPILLGIVGLFIWRELSEMRADVKLLLVQQTSNTTNIENMKTDITMLKATVFNSSKFDKNNKDINTFVQPGKKEEEQEIK